MWDEKSAYPKIDSGFAFKPYRKDVYVEVFNIQTFNQDDNESPILNVKNHNPPNLILQHTLVNEKVGKIETNRMRNGEFVDVLASVDIQKIGIVRARVIKVFEWAI